MPKNKRKMTMHVLAAAVIVSLAISLAFFANNMNNNPERVALQTGAMALTFEDNDNGINAKLDFGSSVTKKFKIINTGTVEASLSLDWKNLVNTYLNRSLSYNLTYSEEENGTYQEIVPETNMPVSSSPIRQALSSELSVPAGSTYYYNLTITLNDLEDVVQDDDLDAVFNTEFDVGDPVKYRYYRLTIEPNGGQLEGEREHLLKNGETVTISSTPAKEGYTFAGWKIQGTSSTFTGNTFTMGISDTYLIAQYTPNMYTLTINPNGGTYSGSTTVDVQYQSSVDINIPTREGYTFTGWTSEDGRVENNKFILTKAKDATLTATWTPNNYKYIVYHNKMNLDGSSYTLVSADTDEGEAEYNTTINPDTKTYTGFTSPSVTPLTIGIETVYPPVLNKVDYKYSRNKYTLTIDPNGGTYNGSSGTSTEEMFYEAIKETATASGTEETLDALGVTPKEGTPNFANAATTDETADGLYSMPDDYGTSYYYRGAVENNYVKFGGFYWRIIRINGDGSIRMQYDGTQAWANGGDITGNISRFTHTGQKYNVNFNDAKYAGWMYGPAGTTASTSKAEAQTNTANSDIKTVVDAWYKTNIEDKGLSKYIGDEIFCNDRSTAPVGSTWWTSEDVTNKGFSSNMTMYGAAHRVIDSSLNAKVPEPRFVCPQKNDAFTVNDTIKGNGNLTYPIGLITVDEAITAGSGKWNNENRKYYLYKASNYWYWTFSPYAMFTNEHVGVAIIGSGGDLGYGVVDNGGVVAPVINIAPEYAKTIVGKGSMTEPYEIPTDDSSNDVIKAPVKEGYTFTGWTKTSGNGTLTSSSFTMGEGNTTIRANYTPKKYSVTFNANGGTVDTASKIVTYNSTFGDLPTPTYEGYKFLGWFTDATDGTQVTSSTSFTNTSNITLYAQWKDDASDKTISALGVTSKEGNPTFANAATTDEGVYSLEDDYGTSYYYRGAVENNYVKFGGFYWRIIRINGDGSIRMIFDGTQAYANANGGNGLGGRNRFTHTVKAWNASYNDAKYVGWMYGPSGTTASTSESQAQSNTAESDLKKNIVDPWYKTNIADKGLSKYVSDEIFCNDRSMGGSDSTYTNLGYGSTPTNYAARTRFYSSAPGYVDSTPKFTCEQKNDAFTVNDTTKGNGALIYPVGLITADEIVAAGSGNYGTTNKYYYLYKNNSYYYWSVSPSSMYTAGNACVFIVKNDGELYEARVHDIIYNGGGVAPVINIATEYAKTMVGTGITTDPYQIPGVE